MAAALVGLVDGAQPTVDSHFFHDLGADSMVMAQFCARVRKQPDLPSVSMKDVYQHPTIRSLATALTVAEPTPAESTLATVLRDILHLEQVSVDSHFFDDLGADSMVMAQFCARLRKQADLPPVSMKDIYQHPTLSSLAAALLTNAPTEPVVTPTRNDSTLSEPEAPVTTLEYVLCGTLQLLSYLTYALLLAVVLSAVHDWIILDNPGLAKTYLRSVVTATAVFFGLCLLPVVAKWLLIGRWKPQRIRVYSLAYFRFWWVRGLVRTNPLVLFVGSPIYSMYLRLLGARIGKGVAIFSRTLPVCTDLLSIGDGTVIRKDSALLCYRAHAGVIETGPVTLGKGVFIGEGTVIDIHTSVGDDAQLGHTSSLHSDQVVPAGERWHGSPGQRTDVDYRMLDSVGCSTLRRVVYSAAQVLTALAVFLPLLIGGVSMALIEVPQLNALLGPGPHAFTNWPFYRHAMAVSAILFGGSVLLGLFLALVVSRVLNLALKPERTYPLYGFHFWAHQAIARMTNIKFFTYLFGDSSYIVNYLRGLGQHVSPLDQTGSNFGLEVKHETPYLVSVGRGTMVADGLSVMNAAFSNTSFRLSRTTIGAHNFLGNNIAYPAAGRTGDNCLLATKVQIPIEGPVRTNIGLLGSPSFEIPRSVRRDSTFDHLRTGDELPRRLAAKNRHNAATMGLYLLVRWVHFLLITIIALAAVDLHHSWGAPLVMVALALVLPLSVFYFAGVERAVTSIHPVRPLFCSIYDVRFWRHERFWKVPAMSTLLHALDGTPFKAGIWRLLGMRVGRRLFDDGCTMPERTLMTIGDNVTLNAGSIIQCHSQEDGAFKSDYVTISSGCTVGIAAFLLYGVKMRRNASVAADAFVMKGEVLRARTHWAGNPAADVTDSRSGPLLPRSTTNGASVAEALMTGNETSADTWSWELPSLSRQDPRYRGRKHQLRRQKEPDHREWRM